jgi:hypothetical protein
MNTPTYFQSENKIDIKGYVSEVDYNVAHGFEYITQYNFACFFKEAKEISMFNETETMLAKSKSDENSSMVAIWRIKTRH